MSAEKLSLDDPAPAPRVGGETRYEFDELLNREVGTFGRRQQLLCFLLILSHACLAFHSLAPVFIAGSPEHWCSIETGAFSNCTLEQLKSLTIPRERKDGEVSFSRCARFASNASRENGAEDEVFTCGGAGQALNETSGRRTEACESWDYDDHYFSKTIVNEVGKKCVFIQQQQRKIYSTGGRQNVAGHRFSMLYAFAPLARTRVLNFAHWKFSLWFLHASLHSSGRSVIEATCE